tara:strand:+ start:280 stop:594 length:315 start_codon:yes stop_codon:yes gene_type:complete
VPGERPFESINDEFRRRVHAQPSWQPSSSAGEAVRSAMASAQRPGWQRRADLASSVPPSLPPAQPWGSAAGYAGSTGAQPPQDHRQLVQQLVAGITAPGSGAFQ